MTDETQDELVDDDAVEDEEDEDFQEYVREVEATAAVDDSGDIEALAPAVDFATMSDEDFEKVMSDPDRFGVEDDEDYGYEPSLPSHAEAEAPPEVNLATLSPAEWEAHLAALMAGGGE